MYEVKGVLMVTQRPDGSFRSVRVNKPHIYYCKIRNATVCHIHTTHRMALSPLPVIDRWEAARRFVKTHKFLEATKRCAINSVT